jgi:hypothetical protein
VSPFIDKVTARKIHFINKGDKAEAALMEERFDMEHMDESLGGRLREPMFVLADYAARMRAGDDEVRAELDAAAAGAPGASSEGAGRPGSRAATAEAVIALGRASLKQVAEAQRRSTEIVVGAN